MIPSQVRTECAVDLGNVSQAEAAVVRQKLGDKTGVRIYVDLLGSWHKDKVQNTSDGEARQKLCRVLRIYANFTISFHRTT